MQHWDAYWLNTKTLNSFAEGEQAQGYSGDIAQFWQQEFSQLNSGAHILDLATGNGALAVLAQQHSATFRVSASDQAKIAPLQLFSPTDAVYPFLSKIDFYGNMPSERLGFNDNQFDLVISQFGFEYAEPEASLQQLYRVLKPGGEMVALIHHQHSFITQDCKVGQQLISKLISPNGLFEQSRNYAKFCESIQQTSNLSQQQQAELKQHSSMLLSQFVALQQQLVAEHREWFNLLAKDLVALVADWRSLQTTAIDRFCQNMSDYNHRLTDQIAAAWDSEHAERIRQLALSNWQQALVSVLQSEHGKLCWVLRLKK